MKTFTFLFVAALLFFSCNSDDETIEQNKEIEPNCACNKYVYTGKTTGSPVGKQHVTEIIKDNPSVYCTEMPSTNGEIRYGGIANQPLPPKFPTKEGEVVFNPYFEIKCDE